MEVDGGSFTIKIAETVIATDNCGTIGGPKVYKYSSISGTYTAKTTGMVELRIHNYTISGGGSPGKCENIIDNIRVYPENPTFEALKREVIAPQGGTFQFQVDVGSEYANKMFIVLQSLDGCTPGFNLSSGTVHVPLNPDAWMFMALKINPYWCNFYGLLDADGRAYAEMSTFGPQQGAENLSAHLSVLVLEDHGFIPIMATNPVYILFIP